METTNSQEDDPYVIPVEAALGQVRETDPLSITDGLLQEMGKRIPEAMEG